MSFLIVFFGAGIGGMLRHGINLFSVRYTSGEFPYGTLAINVIGSLIMGIVAGHFSTRTYAPQQWRLFLTTGILGGFTTFSAFSLDAALLYERGRLAAALAYVLISVVAAIAAVFAGLMLSRA